ncbi:MAG: cytochrome bd ubiquinol oxidase subunit [Solirubrobacterales bacterium]|jgi:cytochrome d ubiquinol oxidase subunit II|nr:cytochrome bd ubiquinol oxidase subunit [Solirubrobacterales bacterium]
MSEAEAVAIVLLVGGMMYAIFGGADFGAGLWQLRPPAGELGARVTRRIDYSLTPVWEANHVWLIFILVVLWTGFPEAFGAVMTTLYIPLALAAVGIVLRGANFAFRHVITGTSLAWATRLFSISSVLTPFFMGTVVGAVASGEVPPDGGGDPMGSWTGLLPLLIGAMFVATGAYLAAVFLVHDARAADEGDVAAHFRRCALGAAVAAGALAAGGVFALRADARFVYDGLTGPGLPLVILSALAGLGALVLLARGKDDRLTALGRRPLAVGAVAMVIWGWGVAQHPYLLPPEGGSEGLTIEAAAAASGALTTILVVFGIAAILILPSLGLLYVLSQRSLLE